VSLSTTHASAAKKHRPRHHCCSFSTAKSSSVGKKHFPVPSYTGQGVLSKWFCMNTMVCAHSMTSLNRSLMYTRSNIHMQTEAQLVACMVRRRCAHCCQVRVCVHHVTDGSDVDACYNGGNLNLATLIGCAFSEERKKAGDVGAHDQRLQVAQLLDMTAEPASAANPRVYERLHPEHPPPLLIR
jgi:hypothetical protein